ncbi:MAG: NAD-dependent epimerase/dehydratase family protein [Chthoniobacterales bacterium]
MKHALVTGGAGLIGSHLADLLRREGVKVRVLDNLEPQTHRHGRPAWVKDDADFVCGDLRDRDGDGSDCPESMDRIVRPILCDEADFVIGSRVRGEREPGSMNFQQIFAGRTAGLLLRLLYGVSFTDMGPFRAIRRQALEGLGMREETYGWNLEMQMRAAQAGLRILEIPVNHRCRAGGESKVSGTYRGTFLAGARILATFLRVACEPRRPTASE